ncbi:MAG: hypothetical protein A3G29_11145 [Burkholderiales bacterium RIFCSPLOWO2_12_FULL_64_99]|nr:MAG: hypothetical protein A3E52_02910 [Burkholderiales bacterium RIFCSPHIGHO2_12_FULL_63_20]OGB67615.1 MAG: hypothetical protein A3G29_11145 [Burkholderiales bacterium RIFCSPLOWO2_12_FULL_64_99]
MELRPRILKLYVKSSPVLPFRDLTSIEGLTMNRISLLTEQVETAVDNFWAGAWSIELRCWWQERKMAAALEETGEYSMVTRWAMERYRVLEQSLKFWRISHPLVLNALEASHRAGVPLDDLKLLALNKDVRLVGDTVKVRRSLWSKVLAPLAVAVVLLNWARLCALVVLTPAPWPGKLVAFAVVTLLFWWLWRGFALYTTRSNAAVERSGAVVEAIAKIVCRKSAVIYRADFRNT